VLTQALDLPECALFCPITNKTRAFPAPEFNRGDFFIVILFNTNIYWY
jgi:hypothetical protein